jgi:hypothetical protein
MKPATYTATVLVFLTMPALSAEINGTVREASGNTATIITESDLVPNVGDKVEIFFKMSGTDIDISVATGRVTKIGVDSIEAEVEQATGEVARDQLVRIHSDTPAQRERPPPGEIGTPVGARSAAGCRGFAGTWDSDFGAISLSLSAERASGTYTLPAGTIDGTVDGSTLEGSWIQNDRSGLFRFVLSADGNAFEGTWTEADGSGGGVWTGGCTGPPSPTMEPRSQVVDFDDLATGEMPLDVFAHLGLRLVRGTGTPFVGKREPNMVLPEGRTQVLLVGGDRVTSLTFAFNAPISRFGLIRIGTAGGASVPTWQLDAYDSSGKLIDSTGEEHGLPAAPQRFFVEGGNIARVQLNTDNRFGDATWATWNSLPIVELEIDP